MTDLVFYDGRSRSGTYHAVRPGDMRPSLGGSYRKALCGADVIPQHDDEGYTRPFTFFGCRKCTSIAVKETGMGLADLREQARASVVNTAVVPVDPDMAKKIQREAAKVETARAERDRLILQAVADGGGVREVARLAGLAHTSILAMLRKAARDEHGTT